MLTRMSHSLRTARLRLRWLLPAFFALLAIAGAGCKGRSRVSDPRLQKIQDMIDAQLPEGTPRARVEFFLHSRGYDSESSQDGKTIIATIRHVDEETLQPVTARVTFTFDPQSKLSSYEIAASPLSP